MVLLGAGDYVMFEMQVKSMRLQTLARMFTNRNALELHIKHGDGIIKSTYKGTSKMFCDENTIQLMTLPREKWGLLKAACAYASGYMLFSDRKVWKSLFKEDAVFVHIVKILEDTRVVMAVVNAFPGTLSWFGQLNEHILSAQFFQERDIENFLYALWVYSMTGKVIVHNKKIESCIVKCMPFVQRARVELNTEGVLKHAEEIYHIVKDEGIYEHMPFPSFYQLGTTMPRQSSVEDYDVWEILQDVSRDENNNSENLKSKESKASANSFFDTEIDNENNNSNNKTDKKILDIELEDISDISRFDGARGVSIAHNADCVNCGGCMPLDLDSFKNTFVKDLHKSVKFKQEILEDNRAEYMKIVKAQAPVIRKMINDMRVILEKRKNNLVKRKLTKGSLDSNVLWKIAVPDLNLFYSIKEPSHELDIAIYLLIDCSGSMVLPGKKGVRIPRIKMARSAAVVLHECCKKLNIAHQITGFSTDYPWNGTVIHYPVVNWGEEEGFKIASLKAKAANRDGYSIRIAVKELHMRSESQKLLIVLSDGAPHCDGDAEYTEKNNGTYDTALAVREAERAGIDVIGMYFGSTEQALYARKIYNNFILCMQIEDLPLMLARTIKRILN